MQTVIMGGRRASPSGSADCDRRGRHGVDDQCPVPPQEASHGAHASATTRPRTTCSSTGWRMPMRRAGAMGSFAEWTADDIPVHPRAAGRLSRWRRSRRAQGRDRQRARFKREIVAGHREGQARATSVVDDRRAAGQGQARQDPGAEARVREGRHDHRRQRSRRFRTAPPRWC